MECDTGHDGGMLGWWGMLGLMMGTMMKGVMAVMEGPTGLMGDAGG